MPNSYDFNANSLSFSLKLAQSTNKTGTVNIYSPQIEGLIYPRIIQKDIYAFFSGVKFNSF